VDIKHHSQQLDKTEITKFHITITTQPYVNPSIARQQRKPQRLNKPLYLHHHATSELISNAGCCTTEQNYHVTRHTISAYYAIL